MVVVGFVMGFNVPITSPSILHNISPKHVWASSIFSEKNKMDCINGKKKRKKKMHEI
jgi:hypothetical protein